MGLTIKPKKDCRWDLVSLGEVMVRLDPGDRRIIGGTTTSPRISSEAEHCADSRRAIRSAARPTASSLFVNEALVPVSQFCVELRAAERASYNGSIEASQASDVGSIPIARSISHDDPVDLTRLA